MKSKTLQHIIACFFIVIYSSITRAELLPPISGNNIEIQSITPADLLARTTLFLDELNLVRLEMGMPNLKIEKTIVKGSSSRETYFQALSLFNKANRFAFEHTGLVSKEQEEVDTASIKSFHNWMVIENARYELLTIKTALRIPETVREIKMPANTTEDEAYSAILYASEKMNQVIGKKIAPADVYQTVTIAINTMAQLLANFDNIVRTPEKPEYQRLKTPTDVYQRLLICHNILHDISTKSGFTLLTFVTDKTEKKTPAKVYDLASLLVANTKELHSRSQSKLSANAYFPGRKTPSDVFQRSGILLKQLQTLNAAIETKPNWLK